VGLQVKSYPSTPPSGDNAAVIFLHDAFGYGPVDFYIYTTKVASNLQFGAFSHPAFLALQSTTTLGTLTH